MLFAERTEVWVGVDMGGARLSEGRTVLSVRLETSAALAASQFI